MLHFGAVSGGGRVIFVSIADPVPTSLGMTSPWTTSFRKRAVVPTYYRICVGVASGATFLSKLVPKPRTHGPGAWLLFSTLGATDGLTIFAGVAVSHALWVAPPLVAGQSRRFGLIGLLWLRRGDFGFATTCTHRSLRRRQDSFPLCFSFFFGRPTGRSAIVKASRCALRLTQDSPPYGWPRSTRRRMDSTSSSVCALFTCTGHRAGQDSGPALKHGRQSASKPSRRPRLRQRLTGAL
jgi:hypothetical protein